MSPLHKRSVTNRNQLLYAVSPKEPTKQRKGRDESPPSAVAFPVVRTNGSIAEGPRGSAVDITTPYDMTGQETSYKGAVQDQGINPMANAPTPASSTGSALIPCPLSLAKSVQNVMCPTIPIHQKANSACPSGRVRVTSPVKKGSHVGEYEDDTRHAYLSPRPNKQKGGMCVPNSAVPTAPPSPNKHPFPRHQRSPNPRILSQSNKSNESVLLKLQSFPSSSANDHNINNISSNNSNNNRGIRASDISLHHIDITSNDQGLSKHCVTEVNGRDNSQNSSYIIDDKIQSGRDHVSDGSAPKETGSNHLRHRPCSRQWMGMGRREGSQNSNRKDNVSNDLVPCSYRNNSREDNKVLPTDTETEVKHQKYFGDKSPLCVLNICPNGVVSPSTTDCSMAPIAGYDINDISQSMYSPMSGSLRETTPSDTIELPSGDTVTSPLKCNNVLTAPSTVVRVPTIVSRSLIGAPHCKAINMCESNVLSHMNSRIKEREEQFLMLESSPTLITSHSDNMDFSSSSDDTLYDTIKSGVPPYFHFLNNGGTPQPGHSFDSTREKSVENYNIEFLFSCGNTDIVGDKDSGIVLTIRPECNSYGKIISNHIKRPGDRCVVPSFISKYESALLLQRVGRGWKLGSPVMKPTCHAPSGGYHFISSNQAMTSSSALPGPAVPAQYVMDSQQDDSDKNIVGNSHTEEQGLQTRPHYIDNSDDLCAASLFIPPISEVLVASISYAPMGIIDCHFALYELLSNGEVQTMEHTTGSIDPYMSRDLSSCRSCISKHHHNSTKSSSLLSSMNQATPGDAILVFPSTSALLSPTYRSISILSTSLTDSSSQTDKINLLKADPILREKYNNQSSIGMTVNGSRDTNTDGFFYSSSPNSPCPVSLLRESQPTFHSANRNQSAPPTLHEPFMGVLGNRDTDLVTNHSLDLQKKFSGRKDAFRRGFVEQLGSNKVHRSQGLSIKDIQSLHSDVPSLNPRSFLGVDMNSQIGRKFSINLFTDSSHNLFDVKKIRTSLADNTSKTEDHVEDPKLQSKEAEQKKYQLPSFQNRTSVNLQAFHYSETPSPRENKHKRKRDCLDVFASFGRHSTTYNLPKNTSTPINKVPANVADESVYTPQPYALPLSRFVAAIQMQIDGPDTRPSHNIVPAHSSPLSRELSPIDYVENDHITKAKTNVQNSSMISVVNANTNIPLFSDEIMAALYSLAFFECASDTKTFQAILALHNIYLKPPLAPTGQRRSEDLSQKSPLKESPTKASHKKHLSSKNSTMGYTTLLMNFCGSLVSDSCASLIFKQQFNMNSKQISSIHSRHRCESFLMKREKSLDTLPAPVPHSHTSFLGRVNTNNTSYTKLSVCSTLEGSTIGVKPSNPFLTGTISMVDLMNIKTLSLELPLERHNTTLNSSATTSQSADLECLLYRVLILQKIIMSRLLILEGDFHSENIGASNCGNIAQTGAGLLTSSYTHRIAQPASILPIGTSEGSPGLQQCSHVSSHYLSQSAVANAFAVLVRQTHSYARNMQKEDRQTDESYQHLSNDSTNSSSNKEYIPHGKSCIHGLSPFCLFASSFILGLGGEIDGVKSSDFSGYQNASINTGRTLAVVNRQSTIQNKSTIEVDRVGKHDVSTRDYLATGTIPRIALGPLDDARIPNEPPHRCDISLMPRNRDEGSEPSTFLIRLAPSIFMYEYENTSVPYRVYEGRSHMKFLRHVRLFSLLKDVCRSYFRSRKTLGMWYAAMQQTTRDLRDWEHRNKVAVVLQKYMRGFWGRRLMQKKLRMVDRYNMYRVVSEQVTNNNTEYCMVPASITINK